LTRVPTLPLPLLSPATLPAPSSNAQLATRPAPPPLPPPVIVKDTGAEVPPPGAGVNTVIWAVPAAAMSLDGMVAWSWVAPTKLVERWLPFQRTTEDVTNPLPLTVSVKPGPPAVAVLGDRVLIAGRGLVAVTVKPPTSVLLTPLVFVTVTFRAPRAAV